LRWQTHLQLSRWGVDNMNPTEVRRLLDELCIDMGFCSLPSHVERQLEQAPPVNADEFARAVFTAEGLDSDLADRHTFRQVRNHIAEAMRRSVIQAEFQKAYSTSRPRY
jgi:hypothetical protein